MLIQTLVCILNTLVRTERWCVSRCLVLLCPASIHPSSMDSAVPSVSVSLVLLRLWFDVENVSSNHRMKYIYTDSVCVYKDDEDGWSRWSEWTDCSVTCGRGGQQRGRSCNSIMPSCTGPSVQTRSCMVAKCDRKGKTPLCVSAVTCRDFISLIEHSWSKGICQIFLKEQWI